MTKFEKLLLKFYEKIRLYEAIIYFNTFGEFFAIFYHLNQLKKMKDGDEKEMEKKELLKIISKVIFFLSLILFILFRINLLIIPMWISLIFVIGSTILLMGINALKLLDELFG